MYRFEKMIFNVAVGFKVLVVKVNLDKVLRTRKTLFILKIKLS